MWKRGEAPPGKVRCALILVSDEAIDSVASTIAAEVKIHCSGTHTSKTAFFAHPLCTFGKNLYRASFYPKIPFAVSEEGPGFKELFPHLENPHFTLAEDKRAHYHALASMAGNFSCLLWQELMRVVPENMALPYLEQQMENLINHPEDALTGPLQRGDVKTVASHLKALDGNGLSEIYQSFRTYYEEKRCALETL